MHEDRSGTGAGAFAPWALLGALALAGLLWGVGSVALMDPDEGRTAEVSREMVSRGDWVVPHLNGLPYLDKPVLLFAATAASIAVLGPTDLAARLPSVLFALGAALLIAALGWRRLGRNTDLLAALVLVTCPLVVAFARIAIFDATMMFWVSASCAAFYLWWEQGRRAWLLAGWAAAGFATLTKGPVGLLLPLLVSVPWALVCGRRVRGLFHPAGLAVFVLVVTPWFLAVTAAHPEFPHYAFVRETFERVATDKMRRTAPFYYFVPLLLGGALPWVLVPITGTGWLRDAWRDRRGDGAFVLYLLAWTVLPWLFFSVSQSKRPGYILPVFPAVALLCAHLFWTHDLLRRRAARIWAGVAGLATVAVAAAAVIAPGRIDEAHIAAAIPHTALVLVPALALATIAAGIAVRRGAPLALATAFVLLPAGVGLASGGLLGAVANDRSARSLARAIDAHGEPRVVGIQTFAPSLLYYLDRTQLLATADGRELGSNYIAEYVTDMRDVPGSTLRTKAGWEAELTACAEPTVFVLLDHDIFRRAELEESGLPLIAESRRHAVYGPCRPESQ